jgi:hypothetical protein
MADLTTILGDLVQQHDAAIAEAAKKRAIFLGGCKSFGQYLLNMESDPSKALTLVSASAFADNAAKLDKVLLEWKTAANSATQFEAAVVAIRNLLPPDAAPEVVEPEAAPTPAVEVEVEQEPEPETPDPGIKGVSDEDGPMDIEALLDSAPQISEVMARKTAADGEAKLASTTPPAAATATTASDDFEDLLK